MLDRINDKAGFEGVPVQYNTVGAYALDYAYGGVKLVKIVSEGGGQTNITCGYDTKKECYYQMRAFLAGMEA